MELHGATFKHLTGDMFFMFYGNIYKIISQVLIDIV